MRQLLHVSCNLREHPTVHVVGHSLRANEQEMYDQRPQLPPATMREKSRLRRLSVPEENVLCATHGDEEGICLCHNHIQRNDFPYRNNSTLTVST